MEANIGMPVVDNFCSSGRHNKINIISVGHTVTDLNVKARDNSPSIFFTLNSSHLIFEKLQEKFKIDCNLHRFKHYKYGIVNNKIVHDYFIVLDKDEKMLFMILELVILTLRSILIILRLMIGNMIY